MKFTYFCDHDRLNLLPHLEEIKTALSFQCPHNSSPVIWDRDGVEREVPRSVLRDMLQLHDDYTALVNCGRVLFPPEPSYTVEWETVDPKPERSHA